MNAKPQSSALARHLSRSATFEHALCQLWSYGFLLSVVCFKGFEKGNFNWSSRFCDGVHSVSWSHLDQGMSFLSVFGELFGSVELNIRRLLHASRPSFI